MESCLNELTDTNEYSPSIDVRMNSNSNNDKQCEKSISIIYHPSECRRNPCKGQLIFQDTFKDSGTLQRNWVVEEKFADAPVSL